MEVIRKLPATPSCFMYFLIPKTVDSDRPLALLSTQIHLCDWVRAEIMENRKIQLSGTHQQKKQEEHSTQSKCSHHAHQNACSKVQLMEAWSWKTHFKFKILLLREESLLKGSARSLKHGVTPPGKLKEAHKPPTDGLNRENMKWRKPKEENNELHE